MENNTLEETLDLRKEFLKYFNFKYYFIASLCICLASAWLYLRYTIPIYNCEAKIKLLDESKSTKISMDIYSAFKKSDINLENETEIIKSNRLIEEVVKNLNLTVTYIHEGKIRKSEIWSPELEFKVYQETKKNNFIPLIKLNKKNKDYLLEIDGNKYTVNRFPYPIDLKGFKLIIQKKANYIDQFQEDQDYLISFSSKSNTIASISSALKIEKVGKESEILTLSLISSNQEKSKAILNELIEVYNQDGIEDRRLVNKRTVDFIDERFKSIHSQLDSIEKNKKQFKSEKTISFLENDASLEIQQKSLAENQLYKIETQIALSEMLLEALKLKTISLLPSNLGIDNAIINVKIDELNKKIILRDRLSRNAGKENEILKQLVQEINSQHEEIKLAIGAYKKQLRITLAQNKNDFSKNTARVAKIPENEKILRGIERQQKIKEDLFLLLLQKREEAAIEYAVTAPSIKIVETALSSNTPVSPKRNIVFLLAVSLGLGIPFGIIYLIDSLNNKIRENNIFSKLTKDIPLVGEIPLSLNNKIFSNKNDRSVVAESFRTLTTNIQYVLPLKNDNKGQVILVTSTIKGEGKTFISSNIALAQTHYDKKVLLIGADMRNPKLHTLFNIEKPKENGLSKYLYDTNENWKNCITKINHLDIIFSGLTNPNPSNLLSNGRFEKLINEAKELYDFIIIDSCPTLYINDSFIISNTADVTIYVTRFNYTDRSLLAYPIEYADQKKLKNVNFVFNGIDVNNRYSYYKYSYKYNYYYGSEGSKKRNWIFKLIAYWKKMRR